MLIDDLLKVLGPLADVATAAGDKLGDVIIDIIDNVCGDSNDGWKKLTTKDVKKRFHMWGETNTLSLQQ